MRAMAKRRTNTGIKNIRLTSEQISSVLYCLYKGILHLDERIDELPDMIKRKPELTACLDDHLREKVALEEICAIIAAAI